MKLIDLQKLFTSLTKTKTQSMDKQIIVKTQKELNAISRDYNGYIYIEGGTEADPLVLNINFEKATVVVRGQAYLGYVSDSAQIGYVSGSAQIRYVSDSAQIGYVSGSAQIRYVSDSAQIGSVSDSAQIRYVSDSAQIRYVSDSAQIGSVSGSAQIRYVSDSAQIRYVSDSAQIGSVSDSAQIRYVSDSAQIGSVSGSAQIELYGEAVVSNAISAEKIICHGSNTVIVHKADKSNIGLVMSKNSHLVLLDTPKMKIKPSFEEFKSIYPVKVKNGKATLYKAVHKRDGGYFSNHVSSFEYKIGEVKEHEIDPSIEDSCTKGLHVSHLDWAIKFGNEWSDMAILECEVKVKDIVVSKDCDGKVRTSRLKVIREVPKEEYWI
jgi:hypothetical protein